MDKFGLNFEQRWQDAPLAVRQSYCEELTLICQLLEPETMLSKWQLNEAIIQQRQNTFIESVYATIKANTLADYTRRAEARKQAIQTQREKNLAAQRQAVQQHQEQLIFNEQQQYQQDTQFLQRYVQCLTQQTGLYLASVRRFDITRSQCLDYQKRLAQVQPTLEGENLKIRLELEAEYQIELTLRQLKIQLQAAAQEEINIQIQQHYE